MSGPLAGIKILDLTRVLAGPYCTMLLAELGAEVIKVERPDGGDDTRSYTPYRNGESCYFMSINHSKKSITCNMKHPQGRALLLDLAKQSDLLVENFKPGVMEKLGLSYQTMQQINPRLIYVSGSGFGQSGPYSDKPAYDLIIQGMSGLMSITGWNKNQPTKTGSSIGDIFTGVFMAVGALAALHRRTQTGVGEHVDIAMFDCLTAVVENAIARYLCTKEVPQPLGNRHASIVPFESMVTKNGHINICCGNDAIWIKFARAIGCADLADNAGLAKNRDRVAKYDEFMPRVFAALKSKTTQEWLAIFNEIDVPAGPINSLAEVCADPHLAAREMFVDLAHPLCGTLTVPGTPFKFSASKASVQCAPPTLGQHTQEVLSQMLKMGSEKIDGLKKDGAI